ncbi:hypothetical protein QAD02_010930 [Eretmocerus hayati]|uniref:Uncharacterized protein n=1 Tax=Eretmocerus hayati TaxID=131215 RepID=A0ACC2NV64_9HYME|nr:hypothetical protein QAD02_010930 [Eretmocerus hayati]
MNMGPGQLFIIISMVPMVKCDSIPEYEPALQHVVNYMKNNLLTYQVTVIVESVSSLSTFGANIVKVMVDEFSSIVVDYSVVEKIPAVRSFNNLWNQTADQSKLKIGIIEHRDGLDLLQELRSMIEFWMNYSDYVRGKCIIFFINGTGESIESFLRFAWSRDFLDLTIIEWINTTPRMFIASKEYVDCEVLIHTFNPFQDHYSRIKLTELADILPEKQQNLYGYPLRTKNDLRSYYHLDGVEFGIFRLRSWAEEDQLSISYAMGAFNFTIIREFIGRNISDEVKNYEADINNATCREQFDFDSALDFRHYAIGEYEDSGVQMNRVKHESFTEISTSIRYGTQLWIMQRKVTETEISSNFLFTCGTLLVMFLIFLLFSRVMNFDKKIWSITKIAKALLGGSMQYQRKMSLKEKIFLITLYFSSLIIITITSDELLKMSINKREVLRFRTLEEFIDSDVNLDVEEGTRDVLFHLGQVDSKMQEIANRTVLVEAIDEYMKKRDAHRTDNSVFGSLMTVPYHQHRFFKLDSSEWYATHLDGIIMSLDKFMFVRKNFPFRDRFGKFFRKLQETGLMMKYNREEVNRVCSFCFHKNPKEDAYKHYGPENDKSVEVSLKFRLLFIILTGYFSAFISFLWEVFAQFWSRRIFRYQT